MMKTKAIVLFAACAATVLAHAQDKKVDLKIDVPQLVIVGTPVPINIPKEYLETPQRGPRASIKVPEGTTNLALNKPVTSSDKAPIVGELTYVTDGDKDGDEGFEVELAPGLQWVQIDLQKQSEIYAIVLWHYHRQKRAYHSVVVQISDDPEFKKDVSTVFNADYANAAKLGAGKDKVYIESNEGKLIPVSSVKGRYVRFYSNGSTSGPGNHYIEVEVYGKPVK